MKQAQRRSFKRLFIAANIILIALLLNISTVSAATLNVNNTDPACNNAGPIYCTISDAIAAANDGDIIQVGAGTYAGSFVIDKEIMLVGNNVSVNPNTTARNPETIITPTSYTNVYINSPNVTINGFHFLGDNTTGVAIGGGWSVTEAISVHNATIQNNIIENYTDSGVRIDTYSTAFNTTGVRVENNLVRNVTGAGAIFFRTNVNGKIDGNVVEDVRVGLRADWFNVNTGVNNLNITNNIAYNTSTLGIWLNVIGILPVGYSAEISNNTIWATGGRGIFISSVGNGAVPIVLNNDIDGAERGYDIWNLGTNPLTIQGGTITNTDYGIRFSDSSTNPASSGWAYFGLTRNNQLFVDDVTISNNNVGVHFVDSYNTSTGDSGIPPTSDTVSQAQLHLFLDNVLLIDNTTGILTEIEGSSVANTPGDQHYLTIENSFIRNNNLGVNVSSDIDADNIDITPDNCIGNTVDIENNNSNTVDAQYNWWLASPQVSGNVLAGNDNSTTPPVGCDVIIPIPHNDNFTTPFNTPLLGADVVVNDLYVTPIHTFNIVSNIGGTATANTNGTIDFTPAPNFIGNAYVHYAISNPTGGMLRQGLVRIEVLPPTPEYRSTPAIGDTIFTPVNTTTPITVFNDGTGTLTISNITADNVDFSFSTTTFDVLPTDTAGIGFDVFCPPTPATATISVEHNGTNVSSPATYTVNCHQDYLLLVSDVVDQDDAPLDGQVYTQTRDEISVRFNIPLFDDGAGTDPDSASNPDNYVLIHRDADDSFETTGCLAISSNETRIVPSSVVYTSDVVASVYTTTLTFNPALGDGYYRLIICGSTSIVSDTVPSVTLNNGFDEIVDFQIDLDPDSTQTPNPSGTPNPSQTPAQTATPAPVDPTPAPTEQPATSFTPPQPEELDVTQLPATGETPLWSELLNKWFGW
jgi:cell division septation protein DedD